MSGAIFIRFFSRLGFDAGVADNRIIVFALINRPAPAGNILLIPAAADGLNREVT
jgi:hypothetical protein